MSAEEKKFSFWLEKAAAEIDAKRPDGELIVSSGASPSGAYHVGHLREFMTADAIAWALRRAGRQARHVHFSDNLDGLRKIPANVPAEYEQYLGMPYCKIPAPDGSDRNYGDFFFDDIREAVAKLGGEMEVIYSHEYYESGKFIDAIEQTLHNVDRVREIIEETSGRQLPKDWVPIEMRGDDGKYTKGTYLDYEPLSKQVFYKTPEGEEKTASYADGHVKLNWRVDWPARWAMLPVAVEPFGRDHATKGGSYDTGAALIREIFDAEPPIPYPYEFINLRGYTKKMSASEGTGITPLETMEVLPPAILKDFVLASRPSLQLFFDVGQGFGRMFEKFDEQWQGFEDDEKSITPMALASSGIDGVTSVSIPFSHMAVAYQSARRDATGAIEILKRSEHKPIVEKQADDIVKILGYVDKWLDKWAPEELKFAVQDELPNVELGDAQRALLKDMAEQIGQGDDHAGDGEWFHKLVHDVREKHGLEPKEAFQAIYRVLLGQDSGPKAGWFLSTFDREFLVERFGASAAQEAVERELSAQITDDTSFRFDPAIADRYPHANVAYCVIRIDGEQPQIITDEMVSGLLQEVSDLGLSGETIAKEEAIASWRGVYKDMGVKPSAFRSSVEAMLRRAIKVDFPRIGNIVDAYNYISVKHHVSMGAMDLAAINGDIVLRYGEESESAKLLGMDAPVEVTPEQIVFADDNQVISWLWNHRDASETAVTDDSKEIFLMIDSLNGRGKAENALKEFIELCNSAENIQVTTSGILPS